MRRILAMLLSLVLLFALAATVSASPNIRVLFDEQEVQFDASPFMENDRTLVPVRALAERLGFTVGWDEREQKITLTKGDSTILLWIGATKVVVNGQESVLDVAPKQVSSRTFVPVRFVAERLGAHVSWDQNQRTAVVTSGKAFLVKLNKQQQPVDQKQTADFQMQMAVSAPDAAKGGNVSLTMPVHMDMHVYHNDLLMSMTLQLPAMGQPSSAPMTIQAAIKDGKLYSQNPVTQEWQQMGSVDVSKGTVDLSAALGSTGFGDLVKLQSELLQDAVVSVAGEQQIDGVNTVRIDADLSRVKLGPILDKLLANLPLPAGTQKPGFKITVDRYLAHFWINPDTQFTYKTTLDMAVSIAATDAGQTTSVKVDLQGEMRGMPVSEPIKFPDMSAPTFTAEQKLAAQAYWDGLTKDVPMEACITATKEVGAHWTDSTFAVGKDAAVKAAACFTQQGQALAALKPPADFADAHKALSLALTAATQAYTGYGEAFALAAKGDMTAANTGKADAAKAAAEAEKALMQAAVQIIKAAARYGLN